MEMKIVIYVSLIALIVTTSMRSVVATDDKKATSNNEATDLVSDICPETTNPSLCNQVLESSRGLDLRGLGEIIVLKAKDAAQHVEDMVKSLARNDDNDEKIDKCVKTLSDAIHDLELRFPMYLKEASERSVSDLQKETSQALTFVKECDDGFGDGEEPKLKAAGLTALDLIEILVVIANKL